MKKKYIKKATDVEKNNGKTMHGIEEEKDSRWKTHGRGKKSEEEIGYRKRVCVFERVRE